MCLPCRLSVRQPYLYSLPVCTESTRPLISPPHRDPGKIDSFEGHVGRDTSLRHYYHYSIAHAVYFKR